MSAAGDLFRDAAPKAALLSGHKRDLAAGRTHQAREHEDRKEKSQQLPFGSERRFSLLCAESLLVPTSRALKPNTPEEPTLMSKEGLPYQKEKHRPRQTIAVSLPWPQLQTGS